MRQFYLLISALFFMTSLSAQAPETYDIPAWYLETDNNGNFYGAFGDQIFVFDVDGNVLDTITTDFDETFGQIVDFRIGLDDEMYVLYDFSNGVYHVDPSGMLTKVLSGRYRYFDVDESGGILASIENGREEILRYSSSTIDTIITLDDNISASNLVFDVQIDADNTFWIAYQKGILSYKNTELIRHNETAIKDLFVGKDDRIYVSYNFESVGYKEPNEDEITPIDFNDAIGKRICGDSNGRIFVSDDNIVYLFSNGIWSSLEISDNVFAGAVDFVIDDQDNVVMSTNEGKVLIWKQLLTKTEAINQESLASIYPNPSSDWITISSERIQASAPVQYRIIASNGTVVQTGMLSNDQVEIKHLPNGTYILHVDAIGIDLRFIKN